jgi:alkylmercury lyase
MTIEIRSGVERPDWSVVKSAVVRGALKARDARRPGLARAWGAGLAATQDLAWRRTLELFCALGRPPLVAEIGRDLRLDEEETRGLIRELEERDLVGLDETAPAIGYAYPLTARKTEHRVRVAAHLLHALCAVDALGVGAIYGTDVLVESSCRRCRTAVRVCTGKQGTAIADARPSAVMVWYDLAYDRKAATSCCPAIAFFCGAEHLRMWRADEGARRSGYDLTLAEAL